MRYTCHILAMLFCIVSQSLAAWSCNLLNGPYRASAGPEVYHTERKLEGGTHQDGWMYGGYASFERVRRRAIYWGIEGRYAWGCADGKTASGSKLKSDLEDGEIEGRLGYTFKKECIYFTPFIGYGKFYGKNKFKSPSPIPCEFHIDQEFYQTGFLSNWVINPCTSIGVIFKARYVSDGQNKITDDPDFDDMKQIMECEWQYEVYVPLRFKYFSRVGCLSSALEPFYRTRHYGGRENFPFDFYDTKYKMYGLRLALYYDF